MATFLLHFQILASIEWNITPKIANFYKKKKLKLAEYDRESDEHGKIDPLMAIPLF